MTRKGGIRMGHTGEHLPEDGLPTSAIVTSEVSTLEHELGVGRKSKVRRWSDAQGCNNARSELPCGT